MGFYKIDTEKYTINPKPKLARGDLHRMSIILVIFGSIGLICSLRWFGFYEVVWESYYLETYGDLDFM